MVGRAFSGVLVGLYRGLHAGKTGKSERREKQGLLHQAAFLSTIVYNTSICRS